jgi:transcriptional regulator with XRE-family HTH domain
MVSLIRQGHFLGAKLRTLRKRNGLTLEELSARCVQVDAARAPSVSYLSMVENGRRVPAMAMLELLAGVFSKEVRWFLDDNEPLEPVVARADRGGLQAMPLEPAFLFSHELLRNALPELLGQTGTSGRQFAQLLIRVWQETHQNDFPDIERAAEQLGQREMPLSSARLLDIVKKLGLQIRWFTGELNGRTDALVRSRFEPPNTIVINERLRHQEERLKYELAFFAGHKILHDGDGLISSHTAHGSSDGPEVAVAGGMGKQDVLYAWRDFECSVFAGALLCPRVPFRRFLSREAHSVQACHKLGVTAAVVMRRMTAVSPYRHWHYFDAYPPGYLRAVYRGNGIPLPWGNMTLVSDPCPQWAVFRLLHEDVTAQVSLQVPRSQVSVMHDGHRSRLYCCHSMQTQDASDAMHVLSVGVDLVPALEAQGYDGEEVAHAVEQSCLGSGDGEIPVQAAQAIRAVSQVLNIHWIGEAVSQRASIICPRRNGCPRPSGSCLHMPMKGRDSTREGML